MQTMKTFSAVLFALGSVILSVTSTSAPTVETHGPGSVSTLLLLSKRADDNNSDDDVGTLYYDNAETSEENNMQCTPTGRCLNIPGQAKGVASSCHHHRNAELYETSSCTDHFILVRPNEELLLATPYSYVKFQ
ncbi:hypothetical protein KVV02_001346 [Mortierella alpina]|uniref:Uncharacterized protein n=1 Tax=Mortierella alpina TaxID=64518 RepID=A0A9P8A641_MORAP|nr:hypothetical protein KVV02_001346 [Mortierella alpina]